MLSTIRRKLCSLSRTLSEEVISLNQPSHYSKRRKGGDPNHRAENGMVRKADPQRGLTTTSFLQSKKRGGIYRCSPSQTHDVLPPTRGQSLALSKIGNITDRRSAKHAGIFATELRRAFIPDTISRARRIRPFHQ